MRVTAKACCYNSLSSHFFRPLFTALYHLSPPHMNYKAVLISWCLFSWWGTMRSWGRSSSLWDVMWLWWHAKASSTHSHGFTFLCVRQTLFALFTGSPSLSIIGFPMPSQWCGEALIIIGSHYSLFGKQWQGSVWGSLKIVWLLGWWRFLFWSHCYQWTAYAASESLSNMWKHPSVTKCE